jgi:hypothetical protein
MGKQEWTARTISTNPAMQEAIQSHAPGVLIGLKATTGTPMSTLAMSVCSLLLSPEPTKLPTARFISRPLFLGFYLPSRVFP